MGDAGADENKIARVKLFHRIAHDPSSRAFCNKAEFKLLVVVPPALIDVVLEDPDVVGFLRIKLDLLQKLLHSDLILFKNTNKIKIAS